MKKVFTTLMMISLTGNVFPLINVLAIAGLLPLYVSGKQPAATAIDASEPKSARKWLLLACTFWVLSYLATGAALDNLFSFEFLRFDGALLIAYLPLLLFTDFRLDPTHIRRCVALFLTILSATALLGFAEFIDSTVAPLGLSVLPEPLQLIHNASLATDIFHGFFRAHNAAGAIYAMATLVSFALLALGKNSTLLSMPTLWLACNFVGLVLTQSRTAYVAFLLAFLIVCFRSGALLRKAFKYGALVLIPLVFILLIQPDVSQRTESVSNLEDPNVIMRFAYYQRAIEDFTQSPIVGIGFGRYNDDLKAFSGVPHLLYFATSGMVVNDDLHAHNSYLHFLAEGGIIGAGLMLAVWISAFRWIGEKQLIFAEGSYGYCLAQALQSCIVLEFVMSMTEHMMGTALSSLTIFTLLGLFVNLVGWKYRLLSLVPTLYAAAEVPC